MDIQKLLSASSAKSDLASIKESGKAASGPVKPVACLTGDDGESDVDIDDPFGEFHIDEDLDDEVPTTVAKPQATGAVSTMSMDISDAPMDVECSPPGMDCPMPTIQPGPVPSSPNAQAMKLNDLEPTSLAQNTPAREASNIEAADVEMQDTRPNASGDQVIPDQQENRISTGANASADVEAMDVCNKEPTEQAVAVLEHQDRPTKASINKQQAAALQQTSPGNKEVVSGLPVTQNAGSTDVVQSAPMATHSTETASLQQQQQPPAQSDQDSGPAASSSSVGITDPLVPTFWDNTPADCAAVEAGSAPQQTSARSFSTLAAAANAPTGCLSEGKAAGTPSSSLPTAPSDGNKNGVTAARATLERTEVAATVGCAATATDAPCVEAPGAAADMQPGGFDGRVTVGNATPQVNPEVSALQEELAAGTGPGQSLLDDRVAQKGTSAHVHLSTETPTHTPAAEYGVHAHRKAGMFKSGAAAVQQKEGGSDQTAALTSGTELTSNARKSMDSGINRICKPTTQIREEEIAGGTALMSARHELGKSNVQAQARSTLETSPPDRPQKTSLHSSPGPAVESLAACNAVQKPSAADANVDRSGSPESTALQQPVRLESSTIMQESISNKKSCPGSSEAAVPAPMASQHVPSSHTLHAALKPASTDACMNPSSSLVSPSSTTASPNQIQTPPPCTNLNQSVLGSNASAAAPAKRKNDPVSEPEVAKQMRSTIGTGLISFRSRVPVDNDTCVVSAQHSNVHTPRTEKPDGNVLRDSTNRPGLPRHQSVSQHVHDSESLEKRPARTPSEAKSGTSLLQEPAHGQHHASTTCEPAQLQEQDQGTEVPFSITQDIDSMSGAQALTSLSKYRREIAELTVSMQEIGIRVEAAADEALELRVDAAVLKNRWGRLAQPETVGTVREELDTARRFLQEAEAAASAATSKATRMGWLKMQPEGMECDP